MNIADFPGGHMERREQVMVMHSASGIPSGRPGIWRFVIAVDSKMGSDVYTYLTQKDVEVLEEDEAILAVATARLMDLVRADPECRLKDGRRIVDMDPRYLYTALT